MPVGRGRRAQTNPQIHQPAARSYEAQTIAHVGAVKYESQASNYDRLAGALGDFNSALTGFGRAAKAAGERADARAKKLQAEQEAAKKREARLAGGGGKGGKKAKLTAEEKLEKARAEFELKHTIEDGKDHGEIKADPGLPGRVIGEENATYESYKELNQVKEGIGKDYANSLAEELQRESDEGYQTPVIDKATGEPTGETKLLSRDEIVKQGLQRQKHLDETFKDKPLIRRHLKALNYNSMQKRIEGLYKAEKAERKYEADSLAKNTAVDQVTQMQVQGGNPDQIANKLILQAVENGRQLYPEYSRDDAIRSTLSGFAEALKNPKDITAARAVMGFVQGSPDSANGVTSFLKHPRYKQESAALMQQASKIVANVQAENAGTAFVKQYVQKVIKGEIAPAIEDIKSDKINGNEGKVEAKVIRTQIGQALDHELTTVNGQNVGRDKPEQIIPRLVDGYIDTYDIKSPKLEKVLMGAVAKKGDPIDTNNPAWHGAKIAALEMLARGPEGERMLRKYVPDHTVDMWKMAAHLERAGPRSADEIADKINVYNEHRKKNGTVELAGPAKKHFKDYEWPEGVSEKDQHLAMEILKMDTLDEPDLSIGEMEGRLTEITEKIQKYNPEYNGVRFDARNLNTSIAQFQMNIKDAMPKILEDQGKTDADTYLVRSRNSFVVYDKDTGMPVRKKNGQMLQITEKLIGEIAKDQRRLRQTTKAQDDKDFRDAGGYTGRVLRWLNISDYNSDAEEAEANRLKGEGEALNEIGKNHKHVRDEPIIAP